MISHYLFNLTFYLLLKGFIVVKNIVHVFIYFLVNFDSFNIQN